MEGDDNFGSFGKKNPHGKLSNPSGEVFDPVFFNQLLHEDNLTIYALFEIPQCNASKKHPVSLDKLYENYCKIKREECKGTEMPEGRSLPTVGSSSETVLQDVPKNARENYLSKSKQESYGEKILFPQSYKSRTNRSPCPKSRKVSKKSDKLSTTVYHIRDLGDNNFEISESSSDLHFIYSNGNKIELKDKVQYVSKGVNTIVAQSPKLLGEIEQRLSSFKEGGKTPLNNVRSTAAREAWRSISCLDINSHHENDDSCQNFLLVPVIIVDQKNAEKKPQKMEVQNAVEYCKKRVVRRISESNMKYGEVHYPIKTLPLNSSTVRTESQRDATPRYKRDISIEDQTTCPVVLAEKTIKRIEELMDNTSSAHTVGKEIKSEPREKPADSDVVLKMKTLKLKLSSVIKAAEKGVTDREETENIITDLISIIKRYGNVTGKNKRCFDVRKSRSKESESISENSSNISPGITNQQHFQKKKPNHCQTDVTLQFVMTKSTTSSDLTFFGSNSNISLKNDYKSRQQRISDLKDLLSDDRDVIVCNSGMLGTSRSEPEFLLYLSPENMPRVFKSKKSKSISLIDANSSNKFGEEVLSEKCKILAMDIELRKKGIRKKPSSLDDIKITFEDSAESLEPETVSSKPETSKFTFIDKSSVKKCDVKGKREVGAGNSRRNLSANEPKNSHNKLKCCLSERKYFRKRKSSEKLSKNLSEGPKKENQKKESKNYRKEAVCKVINFEEMNEKNEKSKQLYQSQAINASKTSYNEIIETKSSSSGRDKRSVVIERVYGPRPGESKKVKSNIDKSSSNKKLPTSMSEGCRIHTSPCRDQHTQNPESPHSITKPRKNLESIRGGKISFHVFIGSTSPLKDMHQSSYTMTGISENYSQTDDITLTDVQKESQTSNVELDDLVSLQDPIWVDLNESVCSKFLGAEKGNVPIKEIWALTKIGLFKDGSKNWELLRASTSPMILMETISSDTSRNTLS